MAVAGEAMTRKNRDRSNDRSNDWLWQRADEPAMPPSGDVEIREPKEG
jgi:hypothetical protein